MELRLRLNVELSFTPEARTTKELTWAVRSIIIEYVLTSLMVLFEYRSGGIYGPESVVGPPI